MKKVNYERFMKEVKVKNSLRPRKEGGRLFRGRPRDKEERNILMKLDKLRYISWLKEGKLKFTAPRKFKLRIKFE